MIVLRNYCKFSIKECKISEINGDRTVYPIHSFDSISGTCYYQLLGVQQRTVGSNIAIWFRSFRFTTGDNQLQQQRVSCQLHLDPVSSAQTMQPCTCHSECECGVLPGFTFDAAQSTCIDIDECAVPGNTLCPVNSNCINTEGSYECISQEGSGNGDDCSQDLGFIDGP